MQYILLHIAISHSSTGKPVVFCPSGLIKELFIMPEPTDKTIYNKMTDFFTLFVKNKISSEHYGTELYLFNVSTDDVKVFREIMSLYWESFSISIEEQSSNYQWYILL
jgi:hypothetical protein